MADNKLLQQMLESLVNDDQAKAEELFHDYVVQQSREIYESLIDSEIAEEDETKEDDEEVDEASEEDEDKKDDDLEENFEDMAYEGDDEMGPTPDMGDDLEDEIGTDEEDGEEKSEEELFMDLESIVDELQAKFDELKGGDHEEPDADNMGGMSDMDADNQMKDSFDLETVREYVEKVPAGHGAEKKGQAESGADKSAGSLKFSKNDMGGTTANILSGKNGSDAGQQGMTGDLKGSGLLKGKPQLQDGGNINTPGAKNGNAFSKKEPGHGAEKAGSKETADKAAAGLFRGRR